MSGTGSPEGGAKEPEESITPAMIAAGASALRKLEDRELRCVTPAMASTWAEVVIRAALEARL